MENLVKIYQYEGNNITFEQKENYVMINATEMAKPFGAHKKPNEFLSNQSTKEFIACLSEAGISASADLVQVIKGNFADGRKQGTWFHEDLAFEYARWLSPEFGIWCNKMIKELLTTGKVELIVFDWMNINGRVFCDYIEFLQRSGMSLKSGSVSARRRRHPSEFILMEGIWKISRECVNYILGYKQIRQQQDVFKQKRLVLVERMEQREKALLLFN